MDKTRSGGQNVVNFFLEKYAILGGGHSGVFLEKCELREKIKKLNFR